MRLMTNLVFIWFLTVAALFITYLFLFIGGLFPGTRQTRVKPKTFRLLCEVDGNNTGQLITVCHVNVSLCIYFKKKKIYLFIY